MLLGSVWISQIQGAAFLSGTYNTLGGDAENDDLNTALEVLSHLVDTSNTGNYRTVVQSNAGSAVWIGNSSNKSYFITAAHIVNAATNTMTTYDGSVIEPVEGSYLHTQTGDFGHAADFGLLEYNAVLDPSLFGGRSLTLMDYHISENYLDEETAAVGYGNLTLDDRKLGRTRMLSYADITGLDGGGSNIYRTMSRVSVSYDSTKPYAGVITSGDSGGGVFLNLDGEDVLLGAVSAGNFRTEMVYTNIYVHKDFINSVVPSGVFTWYSSTLIPEPSTSALFYFVLTLALLKRTRRLS